jgi:glutathione S-transferase
MGEAKLYVIPGSHPSRSAMMMLDHKGIPYKRVDLLPVISKGALKAMRFPGVTVPALKLNGDRVQGSLEIARELDRVQPDPPLFPSDPKVRAEVEAAEAWGDTFQHNPRQLSWWAFKHNRAPLRSYSEGARLGIPIGLAVKTAAPIVAAAARFNESTDENVKADLASLPDDLDRIDAWIKAGVMGGDEPNAADFQIAPTLRLAMTFDDLRPAIEKRPAGELAMRLVPDFAGQFPPVFPPEWLEPLRGASG